MLFLSCRTHTRLFETALWIYIWSLLSPIISKLRGAKKIPLSGHLHNHLSRLISVAFVLPRSRQEQVPTITEEDHLQHNTITDNLSSFKSSFYSFDYSPCQFRLSTKIDTINPKVTNSRKVDFSFGKWNTIINFAKCLWSQSHWYIYYWHKINHPESCYLWYQN